MENSCKKKGIVNIIASQIGDSSYNPAIPVNFTLTINAKPLIIIADSKTKTYGDVDRDLTYTATGLIGIDVLTGSLTRTSGENAGSYAITQGTTSAGDNYVVSYISANLVISKAVLAVKANNQTRCLGQANPNFTLTYTGFKGTDTPAAINKPPIASTIANLTSAVGKYAISIIGGNALNYSFNYQDGELTINALPIITINANKTTLSIGETITLIATGGTTYFWTNNNGIVSGQNTAALTINPTQNTIYTVTALNSSGCSQTASISININMDVRAEVTNILSPNGDGINDFFIIKQIELYPKTDLIIFNKLGRVLYTKKAYNNTWDGTVNGVKLVEGTYYYVLDFGKDIGSQKGFITIITE